MVIMELTKGIVLSIETQRIKDAALTCPWTVGPPVFNKRAGNRKDRAILTLVSAADRNHLSDFCHEGLPDEDFQLLLTKVSAACGPIGELLKLSSYSEEEKRYCHQSLVPFFRSCCKQIFPAIHFLPKLIWVSVQQIIDAKTIDLAEITTIARDAPLFAGFLAYFHVANSASQQENVSSQLIRSFLQCWFTVYVLQRRP